MNTHTRRGIRFAVMTVGFAGLFVAVNAVPGAATSSVPPGSFNSVLQARGALSHGSLQVKAGGDIVVTMNTVNFPGSSGWHSHPGGAIVVVTQGQITTYRSVASDQGEGDGDGNDNARCVTNVYNVGDAFIERPGESLNAVNTTPLTTTNPTRQAIVWATFPGVPHVTSPRTDTLTKPAACPF
jgi:hypothetical protein